MSQNHHPETVDPGDPTAMALPVLGDVVTLSDGHEATVLARPYYDVYEVRDDRGRLVRRHVTEIVGYPEPTPLVLTEADGPAIDAIFDGTVGESVSVVWEDRDGERHELHPIGTIVVYNGSEFMANNHDGDDFGGEEARIFGHVPTDPSTPYEIEFTTRRGGDDYLISIMASPDDFWVPSATVAPDSAQDGTVGESDQAPTPPTVRPWVPIGYVIAALGDWVPAGPSLQNYVHATVEEARAEARQTSWSNGVTGVQILALVPVEDVAL